MPSSGISTNTNVDDFGFWGYSSSSSDTSLRAHIFLDNIVYTIGLPNSINPDSTTWTGNVSTAWMNSGNWTNGIPNSYTDVTIPSGRSRYPLITGDYSCKDLYIENGGTVTISSSGSLTANGNTTNYGIFTLSSDANGTGCFIDNGHVNGGTNYIFNRYFPNKGYHYISSPVDNGSASGLSGVKALYYYNEMDTSWKRDIGWVSQSTSGILQNAKGYACNVTSATTKSFTGVPNTGDVTISVSNSPNMNGRAMGYTDCDGWNLIGNPYPSCVNANYFLSYAGNSGISGTLYFWDDDQTGGQGYNRNTDYASYNVLGATSATGGGSGVLPEGMIAPGQAFFVRLPSSGATTLYFQNWMRTNNPNSHFYIPVIKTERSSTRFSLRNNHNHFNDLIIGFADDATDGFDKLYDGEKMKAHPYTSFYSILNQNEMAIQGLSYPTSTKIVPLGMDVKIEGQYEIKLEEKAKMPNNLKIVLEDRYLNVFTDLTNGKNKYTFKISLKGIYDHRFFIHYIPYQGPILVDINENDVQDFEVYSSDNIVYISNPEGKIIEYSIYDIAGKQVFKGKSENAITQQTIDITGVYIVVINVNGLNKSYKVFINGN